jgi:hypothetical protein
VCKPSCSYPILLVRSALRHASPNFPQIRSRKISRSWGFWKIALTPVPRARTWLSTLKSGSFLYVHKCDALSPFVAYVASRTVGRSVSHGGHPSHPMISASHHVAHPIPHADTSHVRITRRYRLTIRSLSHMSVCHRLTTVIPCVSPCGTHPYQHESSHDLTVAHTLGGYLARRMSVLPPYIHGMIMLQSTYT